MSARITKTDPLRPGGQFYVFAHCRPMSGLARLQRAAAAPGRRDAAPRGRATRQGRCEASTNWPHSEQTRSAVATRAPRSRRVAASPRLCPAHLGLGRWPPFHPCSKGIQTCCGLPVRTASRFRPLPGGRRSALSPPPAQERKSGQRQGSPHQCQRAESYGGGTGRRSRAGRR